MSKNTIKRSIRFILDIVSQILPLRDYIIFESYPDFADNSKNVYSEMIRRESLMKYKMIWLCNNKPTRNNSSHTFFIYRKSLKAILLTMRAKAIICCNSYVIPYSQKQFSFYLTHGTPIKEIGDYKMPSSIRYCLAASNNTTDLMSNAFSLYKNKVIPLGFPRNDELTNSKTDLNLLFNKQFEKIVVWLPTFRQHSSGLKTGSSHAIPILWNKENIDAINKACSKFKTLLLIKPHFLQDISYVKEVDTNNILFINDNFLKEHNITLYNLLGSCSALLTDYSSVYYDYTLCDKPIGLVWEDFDTYKLNPGFAVDMEKAMKGGFKIYSKDDLIEFLKQVYKDEDVLKEQRRWIRDYYNYSPDGRNSQRVVDFIINKAQL